jgi:C1A family cysteine protease
MSQDDKKASDRSQYKLNWKKDPRVHSNNVKLHVPSLTLLPATVNLIAGMPPVLDQGDLGSCVSNATSACLQYCLTQEKETSFTPSRLYIYYNGRFLEGWPANEDTGLYVGDGAKSAAQYSACSEVDWPYNTSKFSNEPTPNCYKDALKDKLTSYWNLSQDATTLKTALSQGFPFMFGFDVYSSFMSAAVASSGIVPMPNVTTETYEGGHCVAVYGYNDATQMFLCQNSWGTGWGQKGLFEMPYAYVLSNSLSSDFWTLRNFGS